MSSSGPAEPDPLAGFLAGIGQVAGMVFEAVSTPRQVESAELAGAHSHSSVPRDVCDHCPICQGAAILERYGPDLVAELSAVARSLVEGLSAATDAAAANRGDPDTSGDGADPGSPG